MYTAYEFTGASIKVGDSEWIPINGDVTAMLEYDMMALEQDWLTICNDFPRIGSFTVECEMPSLVPWLRVFTPQPSIARRKVWRYMEHCGL